MKKYLLVIRNSSDGYRGGTNVLADSLVSAVIPEWIVKSMSLASALEFLRSGSGEEVVIFVQQEGGLSLEYREWAEAVLSCGGRIVEKNVFNMPSRYRPIHRDYVMSVNSPEGALRYRLRSAGQKSGKRTRFVVLPNVVNRVSGDRGNRANPSELKFLRVGRPDPRKWSSWEIRFCATIARQRPSMQIQLTLVGSPPGLVSQVKRKLPPNFTIKQLSYSADVFELYSQHDAYCHYSRIGETYGNTFAEAQQAGLFVVAAADARWDFAPREFLDSTLSIVATRRWLLRNTGIVVDEIQASRENRGVGPEAVVRTSASHYLSLLTQAHKNAAPCPTVCESMGLLRNGVSQIRGLRAAFLVPVWEMLRGIWRRVRQ